MNKARLEAFSDGVIAILITIQVLELKIPHGTDWTAIGPMWPVLTAYVLSFIYIGIYWTNHHHLLHATGKVSGGILWANLHLLFWLSLVPVATAWIGESQFAPVPTAVYGGILFMNGFAYKILQTTIICDEGARSRVKEAVGSDWKGLASVVLYAIAVACAWSARTVSLAIYAAVALMWIIPDRRIESRIRE